MVKRKYAHRINKDRIRSINATVLGSGRKHKKKKAKDGNVDEYSVRLIIDFSSMKIIDFSLMKNDFHR